MRIKTDTGVRHCSSRKVLWHTCRHCEHCNGAAYSDSDTFEVSASCTKAGRDIIRDKDFNQCPEGLWEIVLAEGKVYGEGRTKKHVFEGKIFNDGSISGNPCCWGMWDADSRIVWDSDILEAVGENKRVRITVEELDEDKASEEG